MDTSSISSMECACRFYCCKLSEGYKLHQEEQSSDSDQVNLMQNPHMYHSSPSPKKVPPMIDSDVRVIESAALK